MCLLPFDATGFAGGSSALDLPCVAMAFPVPRCNAISPRSVSGRAVVRVEVRWWILNVTRQFDPRTGLPLACTMNELQGWAN